MPSAVEAGFRPASRSIDEVDVGYAEDGKQILL
jgi:hypothetical protein